jgi:general secretion pathway protein G
MDVDNMNSVSDSTHRPDRRIPVTVVLAAIGLGAGVTHVSMPYRMSAWQVHLDAGAVIVGLVCSLVAIVVGSRARHGCDNRPRHLQHRIILTITTVMAVFGILLSLAVSMHSSRGASKACTLLSLSELNSGLNRYREDTGAFPVRTHGLDALLHNPDQSNWHGPYMKDGHLPRDAWGNEFRYRLVDGTPELRSAGQDGIYYTADDLVIGGKSNDHWWSRLLPGP